MPLFTPTLPMSYFAPLPAMADGIPGFGLDARLQPLGLERAALHDAGATLTFAAFDALVSALVAGGRSDAGFELGKAMRLEAHGPLALPFRRCATFDAMLRLATRYSRLVSSAISVLYTRRQAGGPGELVFRPAAPMSTAALHAIVEMAAVGFYGDLCSATGPLATPFDAYLSIPAPPHRARYAALRPARYHFDTPGLPGVRIVVPAALLDLPRADAPPPADPANLAQLQAQFSRARPIRGWVETMLREAIDCQPTLADLAQLLDTSPRTLRRHLAQEGASLHALGKTIRHERACTLLRASDLSLGQIACQLGYTDAANFSHAFKTVQGVAPSAYRQAKKMPGG